MDYVIDTRAVTLEYETDSGVVNVSTGLSRAIAFYEVHRESDPKKVHGDALDVFIWMERAFAHGLVKQGGGLIRKLNESQEENERLKKKVDELDERYHKCSEEKLGLEHKNAELQTRLDDIRKEDMRNAAGKSSSSALGDTESDDNNSK